METLSVRYLPPAALVENARNARVHSPSQVAKLARAIKRFGFTNPIIVDADAMVLCGHGRLLAAKKLGLATVPTVELRYMTPAQKRAFVLADNQLGDESKFDKRVLALELEELLQLEDPDFEIDEIGFELPEIDALIDGLHRGTTESEAPEPGTVPAIARRGDLWQIGKHLLFCGDALDPLSYGPLLNGEPARIVFTDPPYNCRIGGNVSGLGKIKHREFVQATGEMSDAEFAAFLTTMLSNLKANSVDGSIHYVCMDFRQIALLINAGKSVFGELKNLCVWDKGHGSMGAFYRGQHELIAVFKNGKAPHLNQVQLGRFGRNRTNVWSYPGMAGFQRDRDKKLALHSTVKPTALVGDAILDASNPGDLVLDPFCGSGTTLIAAHRTNRRCCAVELDPRYVDVALHRVAEATGLEPVNLWTGLTANQTAEIAKTNTPTKEM
ncbi:MAG: site-specific DNA-methyltransferase [Sphingomonas sp.]|uniref:site-specific DNA-methyltransferase n=1 Tax=Sphingomonas sp. TaxID=28214 RepID=UPI001AC0AB32|nr:site-specific DNA-methyltransferase [Sphingomonas sp.]MBN8809631.1 site-specific DNA-methyltransferase [Sphingomonas sp.]